MSGRGVNKARIFARFTEKEDRDKSSEQIVEEIRLQLPVLQDVEYLFEDLTGALFGTGGKPVEVHIYGSDLARLDEIGSGDRRVSAVSGLHGH